MAVIHHFAAIAGAGPLVGPVLAAQMGYLPGTLWLLAGSWWSLLRRRVVAPVTVTVLVLDVMWIWNDFLLPYLVLDLNKYKTISIAIQYMKGSYGRVDMGAIMAALILAVIPVIIFYLACQKHIIKGVAAGAVKG